VVRRWLDFLLAQAPRLYAAILARRRRHNPEKLLFLRLLRRGDVILDGGANDGTYTLLFSHVAGPRGQVHAFEPVPATLARLAETLARGGVFRNVVTNSVALGETTGEAEILVPGDDPGQASLRPHRAGSWEKARRIEGHACRITTLDAYLPALKGRRPTFVKLDLEGAELPALRGGAALLEACSPLLYVEVHRAWTLDFGYRPEDLVAFLHARGYRRFLLVADRLTPLADPAATLAALSTSANLLCAAPDRNGQRLEARLDRLPARDTR
jgi:FkbM family methyltransferase